MGDAQRSAERDRARHIGGRSALRSAANSAASASPADAPMPRLMQFVAWVERQRRRPFSLSLNKRRKPGDHIPCADYDHRDRECDDRISDQRHMLFATSWRFDGSGQRQVAKISTILM